MDKNYVANPKPPDDKLGGKVVDYRKADRLSKRLYSFYRQTTDKVAKKMTTDIFWDIIKEYNSTMIEDVFKNKPWYLPHGLGRIQIIKVKCPPTIGKDGKLKGFKIWKAGKLEFANLSETDWYLWRFMCLRKKKYASKNVRLYEFKAEKKHRKRLCELIKEKKAYFFDEKPKSLNKDHEISKPENNT